MKTSAPQPGNRGEKAAIESRQEFIAWLKDEGIFDTLYSAREMQFMYRVWEKLSVCECGRQLSRGYCKVCDNDE